jgi:hypothetical protein
LASDVDEGAAGDGIALRDAVDLFGAVVSLVRLAIGGRGRRTAQAGKPSPTSIWAVAAASWAAAWRARQARRTRAIFMAVLFGSRRVCGRMGKVGCACGSLIG